MCLKQGNYFVNAKIIKLVVDFIIKSIHLEITAVLTILFSTVSIEKVVYLLTFKQQQLFGCRRYDDTFS